MKKIIISHFLFLLFTLNINAQKYTYETVSVDHIGNENTTPAIVLQEAITKAKLKALNQAGIAEYIKTSSSSYARSEDYDYKSVFTSSFFTEMAGAVAGYEIIEKKARFTDNDLPAYFLTIKAKIIKYKEKKDLGYKAKIEGIEMVYFISPPKKEHRLEFSFVPQKNTFLSVFVVWDSLGFVKVAPLYPFNDHDLTQASNELKKGKNYVFGRSAISESEISLLNMDLSFDTDNLPSKGYQIIFVMHKDYNPYSLELEYESLQDWIAEIPRHKKWVEVKDLTIYKK